MTGELAEAIVNVHQLHAVVDAAAEADGFTTFVTGRATGGQDFQDIAERDLQKGELVALPIAFLILVLVFGAFAAALLPSCSPPSRSSSPWALPRWSVRSSISRSSWST